MNAERARSLASEGLIIGAIVGAANLLVVEPAVEAARRSRSALQAMRETIQQAALVDRGELERTARRVEWVEAMNALSGDAAQVYQTISAVALRCGVQVDRVQPTPFVPDSRTGKGVTGLGCSIVATGTYESVGRFLDALQVEAGFSAPIAIRLAPIVVQGEELVQASVESMHRAVDLGAIAAAMDEASTTGEDEE